MEQHLWNTWIILLIVSDFVLIFSNETKFQFLVNRRRHQTTTNNSVNSNDSRIDTEKLVCVDDYEKAAFKVLDKNARTYFAIGSDEEITLRENKLGYKSFPFGVSPTAFQKLATPEGEAANARAAAAMGIIYILSSLSNTKIEDVAKAAPGGRKWMQLQIFRNKSITANIMQRAEANGFEAFAVSIDTPVFGRNRENLREPFFLPDNLKLANFGPELENLLGKGQGGFYVLDELYDPSITWKDFRWVKRRTRLPVIVKGLLNPKDVDIAIRYQADGILVSNQGARQLETNQATIDALPEIVHYVGGRVPVFLDGGVRMGTDIFKALALGADMVFAGRPLLWGLSVNGEQGAKKVMQILKDEFNNTMALSGIQNVPQITEDFVGRSVSPLPGQGSLADTG